jgi:hypothetical protein
VPPDRTGVDDHAVGGLDLAVVGDASHGPAQTLRVGPIQWLLTVGEVRLDPPASTMSDPGVVAAACSVEGAPALVARIELDVCGAWATIACSADLRPLVVRRAGWVDERGDAVLDRRSRWPEDRVGLGPGDGLVVPGAPTAAPDDTALRLLDVIGSGGGASALAATVGGTALVVPAAIAGRGRPWVAEATGIAEAELVLPGYPLGDAAHPDVWKRPPSPPRQATFLLHRDVTRLSELRDVLQRLLRSWRLTGRVDEDALVLLTSEVAANALVHTGTDATAVVGYLGSHIRVGVRDSATTAPTPRAPAADQTNGRGLAMVEAVAASWGTSLLESGKEFWFELPFTDEEVVGPSG